jgi:N-acetylmuramoyl-L-alanine amidase
MRIKDELVRAGFMSAYLMTTTIYAPEGLNQRIRRAKKLNADILLSIHHDAVNDQYLKRWTYQTQEHFYFDESNGFSLHVSTKNPYFEDSVSFARLLADELLAKGFTFNRVHELDNPLGAQAPYLDSNRGIYRRDDLMVLGYAKMPTVLLEAGVIVNRNEELLLQTTDFQGRVATAVINAVRQMCSKSSGTR